ncbi:MarR family winged helix-turn-helix transcriptional regulator [Ottowia thiooxydans]|uniref:DNA-binding MarR family transcriptional regulator n=1 Tax=Ottowia thiooxydans TaxID=219182 RepID=A0ABV2QH04_9BURK
MLSSKTQEVSISDDEVDTSYLKTLVGYNARRAALTVISLFVPRMAEFGLRPVDFSILSVIGHNPGITSKQLCRVLDLLPPNLVGKIGALEQAGVLERRPHPSDGRALGLHLTASGYERMRLAERAAFELEAEAAGALTAAERRTLIRLLQKVYEGQADS